MIFSIKWRYIFEGKRRLLFLILDVSLSLASYLLALSLRYEMDIPPAMIRSLWLILPSIIFLRAPCYVYFDLYQTLWKYLGTQELISIIKAVTAGSLFLPVATYFMGLPSYPRSVFIIDWFILIIALGGSRIGFKIMAEKLRKLDQKQKKNVLIIGAEDSGEQLVREFIKRPELGYKPVGFLDNQPSKIGLRIHGVKVMGRIRDLPRIVRLRKVDEVIIALPKLSGDEIKDILASVRNYGLTIRIIPQMPLSLTPDTLPLKLRRVDIADLLGRDLVQADFSGIRNFFLDKKVLVTGAGGSIGSELVKTICKNFPLEMILIDNTEKNLHEIETEVKKYAVHTKITSYEADVTDAAQMNKIFQFHHPQVVYHAAAYKQVPFVELHCARAIQNNVMGTKIVADLAARTGVNFFILISTDKAINPRSVMGTTKRIAELYTQSLKYPDSCFISVRFGNVFNSNGSIIPVFKKQIEEGGPLTITHLEMTRYFMDVTEAVYLILQATILGSDSEIFVLDMGKPVKIVDLAKDLIQLMGLNPETFPIQCIGLRPGEKINEELVLDGERAISTTHNKIKIWKSEKVINKIIDQQINDLNSLIENDAPRESILQKLKEIVPEYEPWK